MTDLFRLTARVGNRFGGWEVGGSIDLIEIYRFPSSNLDFDPIWAILIIFFYIFVKKAILDDHFVTWEWYSELLHEILINLVVLSSKMDGF